jgi:hypothetical protein
VATAVVALCALLPAAASAAPKTGVCGLPSSTPVFIDYGEGTLTSDVRGVFARPGVVVASSGTNVPADFRKSGAATMYFVLHLPALVGEPSDPEDPSSIIGTADTLYAKAVTSSGCPSPWIALNELAGPGLATPWSATNTIYRADVLALDGRASGEGRTASAARPRKPEHRG